MSDGLFMGKDQERHESKSWVYLSLVTFYFSFPGPKPKAYNSFLLIQRTLSYKLYPKYKERKSELPFSLFFFQSQNHWSKLKTKHLSATKNFWGKTEMTVSIAVASAYKRQGRRRNIATVETELFLSWLHTEHGIAPYICW